MFKTAKWVLYLVIAVAVLFLYWFLPKYAYVHKNPGYCTNLTQHLYYCGNDAGLDKLFK